MRFQPDDEAYLVGLDTTTREIRFFLVRPPAVAQVPAPAAVPDGAFTVTPVEPKGFPSSGIVIYVPANSRIYAGTANLPWMMEAYCVKPMANAAAERVPVRVRLWQPETQAEAQRTVLERVASNDYNGTRVLLLSCYKKEDLAGDTCVTLNPMTAIVLPDEDTVQDVLQLGGFGPNGGDGGPLEVEGSFAAMRRELLASGAVTVHGVLQGIGQVTIPDVLPYIAELWPSAAASPNCVEWLKSATSCLPVILASQSCRMRFKVEQGIITNIAST
ncbi:hypothetical protein DUNSADRAFT_2753 [Dunaliella salina]|uniref:Uncharacterized protein n=1 Tax=Dunaliella salina TaxID=3046 RepID=A0ABQ7FW50_DUNSA|nr:hypothetical protein DUNSADRAFT_2753 [Dunaliella salina]KAF5826551.1 hypothetical protein DUNSADRAFT_2753 [Dunaliella salina]KAF5826552.1 hypothetical protein DUNSADRAFT_2753 [Dunaliella salina]|eukprot:KAF5826547.1 hypothetical protein DUNSADRAFT_2753 [Dunaliella salina]